MYIEDISIKNFRGIEDIKINFDSGVNILIGDNGAGKTTLLEALTIALGGYLQGIQNLKVSGIRQEDFRWSNIKLAGASNQIIYHSPEIEFHLNIEKHSEYGMRCRSDRSGNGKTITKCRKIQQYAKRIANEEAFRLPLLSYMGISRVTMSKRADYGKKVKNQMNDRRCGYIGCMDSVVDKTNIIEWIKKMSYEAVFNQKEIPELSMFLNVVSEIVETVDGLEERPQIRYSAEWEDIVYIENGTTQPISQLSAGYQSLLWMAMDFAFRLALLNPEIGDAREATGIILIDEIDMHLHPKWQWNILNAFRKTFPNMQFIVATHSPIIIASCPNATLIHVNNCHEIEYLDDAYAYSINHVLELRQDSQSVLKELRSAVSQFEQYLTSGQMELAKQTLSSMEEKFGYYNSEVVEARTEYELETILDGE